MLLLNNKLYFFESHKEHADWYLSTFVFFMLLTYFPVVPVVMADNPLIASPINSKSQIVTINLSGEIDWASDGAGTGLVYLNLQNHTADLLVGELRLIPVSINNRINFEAVEIEAQKYPDILTISDDLKTQKGFFIIDTVKLNQTPQEWKFFIHFPQKSAQPNNILQLYVMYKGDDEKYGEWLFRDVLSLKIPIDVD